MKSIDFFCLPIRIANGEHIKQVSEIIKIEIDALTQREMKEEEKKN